MHQSIKKRNGFVHGVEKNIQSTEKSREMSKMYKNQKGELIIGTMLALIIMGGMGFAALTQPDSSYVQHQQNKTAVQK